MRLLPYLMCNLTDFGFSQQMRRLALFCKASAYRVCCKCAAFDRDRRTVEEILEGEKWVVAYKGQPRFNNSILSYLEKVWAELTALPNVPSDPLLHGLRSKAPEH
eukprot:839141-Pyramimonas_sp.AAC.1